MKVKKIQIQRRLILLFSILIINLTLNPNIFAQTQSEKDKENEQKIRAFVEKIGEGEKSKIVVKLKDGDELKGNISQINNNDFVITSKKSNSQTTIQYSQVKKIKKDKVNVFLIAGIIAGVVSVTMMVCIASGPCSD